MRALVALLVFIVLQCCFCGRLIGLSQPNQTENMNNQKAVLSLTFDDGPMSAYTNALPCLQNRSLTATVYCSSDNVGYGQALSKEQILDLQNNYGWEIGSHTKNHIKIQGKSAEVIETQVSGAYDSLTALGAKVYGLAYPFGQYDANVIAITEKYHIYGRAAQESFCQNLHLNFYDESRYCLLCSTWDNKSLEQVEEEITTCIANKSWLIGLNHGINNSGEMSSTTWNSLMEYAKSKVDAGQLIVKTVFEGLEYYRDRSSLMSEGYSILDQDQKYLDLRRDVFKDVTLKVAGESVTNLLGNSGFENARAGSPDMPQYWSTHSDAGTISFVTNVVHSGRFSVLLNRTFPTDILYIQNSDQNASKYIALPAVDGETYTLSVWVSTGSTAIRGSTRADLAFFRGSDLVSSSTAYTNIEAGWQRIVVSSRCPFNVDSVSVYLYVAPGLTGWAYFDDVMLTSDTDILYRYIEGPTTAQTTDPRIRVGNSWYNYSGILDDGQETNYYKVPTLLGGQEEFNAQIAGSKATVAEFLGTRVLYVDKAWVKISGDTITFDTLFDKESTTAVIYCNIKIQFIPGITYDLSESNIEGATFYFEETHNYYAFNTSKPYVSYCTNNVTEASFNDKELIFSVAPSTSVTGSARIYVGSNGKPSSVEGATKWDYEDSSGNLMIDFAGLQSQIIEVSWATPRPSVLTVIAPAVIIGIMVPVVSFAIIRRHKNKRHAPPISTIEKKG